MRGARPLNRQENRCLIRAKGLKRTFGEFTAVKRIDFEIMAGEIFGLVGPDGAGKTTTLRLLSGLLTPSEGSAEVAGIDVYGSPDRIRDVIGYMPQRFGLYDDLRVSENLHFYADLFGLSEQERHPLIQRLLKMTRMEAFSQRLAGQLSGGMKQKLALSCALLHRPQVLFLDEPTNGVDPISRRDFWAILYQLVKDGVTVMVTTSYLDEAERCNRVALLNEGRLIACENPEALRERYMGRVFACRCRDRDTVRQRLRSNPGIISAQAAGDRLHFCLAKGVDLERDVIPGIASGIEEIEPIRPSLEDVFIAMISETGKPKEKTVG